MKKKDIQIKVEVEGLDMVKEEVEKLGKLIAEVMTLSNEINSAINGLKLKVD